jgi:transaldolase/glucose-6-phosphate isomerase
MTRLLEIHQLGQSIWYDNIRRALISSGELAELVSSGVRGVTSNPTIFEKAIAGSTDYDDLIADLAQQGRSAEEMYEELVLEDIASAADLLRELYDDSDGIDGYVSLEVNPSLARDTSGTVEEGKRLFDLLNRPNIMIKVPATREGIPAIEELTALGINVNVTLIFSLDNYLQVAEAYLSGLERLAEKTDNLGGVSSVASFFVSRVDTAVDLELERLGGGATSLLGTIAISNAKAAYQRFLDVFRGERWEKLERQGARVQRPLWASTGTKNPAYPDTFYVDALIGAHTVNTVPPSTLKAVIDHGQVGGSLEENVEQAHENLLQLEQLDINLDQVTELLQEQGVQSFAKSFEDLLASIEQKREEIAVGQSQLTFNLGKHAKRIHQAMHRLQAERVLARIWDHDHTVWKPEPSEIVNRLGWLHSPEVMTGSIPKIESLTTELMQEGITKAVLLGMGGSSLAPEVFARTFPTKRMDLKVVDTTDPAALLAAEEALDISKSVFIVATKSGGTVETLSLFKHFFNRVEAEVGQEFVGNHFIAITDPNSALAELAERYHFRQVFINDPNIGGRYSALSYFGMVPASLVGVDLQLLLDRAQEACCGCDSCVSIMDNPGAHLGAMLGELANAGRDKLTLVLSKEIASFGDWIEQLVAESTGKDGKGILPVVGEELANPSSYHADRVFVQISLQGEADRLADLEAAGHPVIRLALRDTYDLGGQFFLWEMATAVAGQRMRINPFDQPNVESAKVRAREMVAEFERSGALPPDKPTLQQDGVDIYMDGDSHTDLQAVFESFFAQAVKGSYIAVHAYLPPGPEIWDALHSLRAQIRSRSKMATSLGYGPRFLHSTGQLHKGDAGKGLFIQLTTKDAVDVDIPDAPGSHESAMSFGVLKAAQAAGDRQALLDAGRNVVRFHFKDDALSGIQVLDQWLGSYFDRSIEDN